MNKIWQDASGSGPARWRTAMARSASLVAPAAFSRLPRKEILAQYADGDRRGGQGEGGVRPGDEGNELREIGRLDGIFGGCLRPQTGHGRASNLGRTCGKGAGDEQTKPHVKIAAKRERAWPAERQPTHMPVSAKTAPRPFLPTPSGANSYQNVTRAGKFQGFNGEERFLPAPGRDAPASGRSRDPCRKRPGTSGRNPWCGPWTGSSRGSAGRWPGSARHGR